MKTLQDLQKLLQSEEISSYYLTATEDSPIAQLIIEVQTAEQESNHLELCLIPTPDSPVFLLQVFMQLPLAPPFQPNDRIPEFLLPNLHHYMGVLNQVLPLPGFYCLDAQLQFRHIFATEDPTQEQLTYIIETSGKLVQLCQPILQKVAIGACPIQEAIEAIPKLFSISEE